MEKEEKNIKRKKPSKLLIVIIILIVALVLGVVVWTLIPKTQGENIINDIDQELINKSTASGNSSDINNIIITNEGIKVNVSEKMFEERTIGKFTIKNMNISSQNGMSTITFTIKNNSSDAFSDKEFTIKLLNNKGKEIGSVTSVIDILDGNAEKIIYVNSESDLSNSYNYKLKI